VFSPFFLKKIFFFLVKIRLKNQKTTRLTKYFYF